MLETRGWRGVRKWARMRGRWGSILLLGVFFWGLGWGVGLVGEVDVGGGLGRMCRYRGVRGGGGGGGEDCDGCWGGDDGAEGMGEDTGVVGVIGLDG